MSFLAGLNALKTIITFLVLLLLGGIISRGNDSGGGDGNVMRNLHLLFYPTLIKHSFREERTCSYSSADKRAAY